MNHLARRRIVERALQLECKAVVARLQADLLMETLSEVGHSHRTLQTDRRRLRDEAAVMASHRRELVALNEELELFSFAVAHDLRQPLLGAQILLDHAGSTSVDVMPMVGEAVGEALARIDALMALAHLAHQPLQPEVVGLSALVDEVVARTGKLYPEVTVDFSCEPLGPVFADPLVLGLIVENLVTNAFKYGVVDGRLTLVVRRRASVDGVVVELSDRGSGLSAGFAARAFEPFRREGAAKGGGIGLGLALVQRGVARLGGQVWYEPASEGGACFCVDLPTHDGEDDRSRPPRSA